VEDDTEAADSYINCFVQTAKAGDAPILLGPPTVSGSHNVDDFDFQTV